MNEIFGIKESKTREEINEWASSLSVEDIQNLSEDEILEYAEERPGCPGVYGFMLGVQYFDSEEHLGETLHALLMQIKEIENIDEKMLGN